MTRERVRQLETKALTALADRLGGLAEGELALAA